MFRDSYGSGVPVNKGEIGRDRREQWLTRGTGETLDRGLRQQPAWVWHESRTRCDAAQKVIA